MPKILSQNLPPPVGTAQTVFSMKEDVVSTLVTVQLLSSTRKTHQDGYQRRMPLQGNHKGGIMDLADIQKFQEDCMSEFQEKLQRYYEWEQEAQRELNSKIYGLGDEGYEEEEP